jgi:hypothetical protein
MRRYLVAGSATGLMEPPAAADPHGVGVSVIRAYSALQARHIGTRRSERCRPVAPGRHRRRTVGTVRRLIAFVQVNACDAGVTRCRATSARWRAPIAVPGRPRRALPPWGPHLPSSPLSQHAARNRRSAGSPGAARPAARFRAARHIQRLRRSARAAPTRHMCRAITAVPRPGRGRWRRPVTPDGPPARGLAGRPDRCCQRLQLAS